MPGKMFGGEVAVMKRIRLVKAAVRSADLFSADIVELMTRLKLLYEVPFS